jgi:hypothetical protein
MDSAMRRGMIRVVLFLSALAAMAACGGSGKDDSATPKGGDPCGGDPCGGDPCGGAAAVEDFSGWDGWTKVNEARFVSKGHQKAFVDVYVEAAGVDIYRAKGTGYPVGTRLVKAQYKTADAATPFAITTMKKMPAGYDADNGNWFYGVYDASGAKAMKSGKIDMCINCHDQADESDWVFGPQ